MRIIEPPFKKSILAQEVKDYCDSLFYEQRFYEKIADEIIAREEAREASEQIDKT